MVGLEIVVIFMKHFDTIYNITQEPQEVQRYMRLWVHRQVCCDINCCQKFQVLMGIAFRPVGNNFLLIPSLKIQTIGFSSSGMTAITKSAQKKCI